MKATKDISLFFFLGAFALNFLSAGNVEAISIGNLTGMWTDDHGHYIEVERNGPGAVATMLSPKGRDIWVRGTMDFSGPEILMVKRRNNRIVGQARGEFVNKFGRPQIRWNSGRTWKKSTRQAYNAHLKEHHDYGDPHLGGYPGVPATNLQGRWQTNDKTIIQITQNGSSLSIRVLARQGSGHSRHPWTSGTGRISNSELALDCYHGTKLAERITGRYLTGEDPRIKWSNGHSWHRQPDNLRVITEPVVAVCRLPVDVVGTALPSRPTSTWQYDHGGYFHRGNDGRWIEFTAEGQSRYRYRETERTKISVTLFDDRRGISVHLQKDQCWIQQSGLADWRQVSRGHWSQRPPAGDRRPGSRHHGHNHGSNGNSPTGYRPQPSHDGRQDGGGLGKLLQGLFGR